MTMKLYKKYIVATNLRLDRKEQAIVADQSQQATLGLLQGWLEVVAIISSAYPGFCSGGTSLAKHLFLIFIFIKSRVAVTGGRNSNATPAQSPVVRRKLPSTIFRLLSICSFAVFNFVLLPFFKTLFLPATFCCCHCFCSMLSGGHDNSLQEESMLTSCCNYFFSF